MQEYEVDDATRKAHSAWFGDDLIEPGVEGAPLRPRCHGCRGLLARIAELEAEVEAELRGQCDISAAKGAMHERLSARIDLLASALSGMYQERWGQLPPHPSEVNPLSSIGLSAASMQALRALYQE